MHFATRPLWHRDMLARMRTADKAACKSDQWQLEEK